MKTMQQFPIGKLKLPETISKSDLEEAITVLKLFPEQLKQLVYTLKEEQLEMPYREGSWTIRQLIHHISDSHHHAYNRIRWTLTEDTPTIKAYDQDAYASMDDYNTAPIVWSLTHIEILHQKMVAILSNLGEEEWNRSYHHPETDLDVSLKALALTYAWHSLHHYAHIKNALT
ncbi:putative metal-dependent hydrolase [Flavobacteriaceae bacterium TK19130]|nr:putative metal-dependent hydrolase [Thermobacterium salinum]